MNKKKFELEIQKLLLAQNITLNPLVLSMTNAFMSHGMGAFDAAIGNFDPEHFAVDFINHYMNSIVL